MKFENGNMKTSSFQFDVQNRELKFDEDENENEKERKYKLELEKENEQLKRCNKSLLEEKKNFFCWNNKIYKFNWKKKRKTKRKKKNQFNS